MTKEEAVKIISGILAQLKLTIAEHQQVQKAFEILKDEKIIKSVPSEK